MNSYILRNFLLVCMMSCTSLCFAQLKKTETYPDSINSKKLYTAIGIETGSYIAGLSFLRFIWYKDHERVPFHWYNDSKGYLQIDKCGHAYSAYRESYAAYYALRRAGVKKNKALIYGGPMGLVFQTPIEIFDGLYEGWGFSWSDMAANTFGSLLFSSQELFFDEQIIKMKFSYRPSIYPNYHDHLGVTPVERFFLDYNAHTYWLSANLNAMSGINKIPAWLNVALGYSANGMIYEFDNPTMYQGKPFPYFERYRQYILSLDVDFTKIKTNKKWLKHVFNSINLLKVPFPALEYNRVQGFRFRSLYF
ncbi:MAG: DUF2279 domain-containing protein [Chitinophagaceae bacterium]